MKKLNQYHEMLEEPFSIKKYFIIFFSLSLILGLVLMIPIDFNLFVSLVKNDVYYEAYFSKEQLEEIEDTGIFMKKKEQYHYQMQLVEDHSIAYEGSTYYLARFQFQEEVKNQVLSGRIQISRNTLFKYIISLWKEES